MSEYLDEHHRQSVLELQASFAARSEWPTWLLIAAIYGTWFGTLAALHAGWVPLWVATPLLIIDLAWYMSLQHELLHGHPTRHQGVNKALGYAPLAVWFPYTLYRDSHLTHHRDEDLTFPGVDPESAYIRRDTWHAIPRFWRTLLLARRTFIGRIVVGPPVAVASMFLEVLAEWRRGDWRYLRMWVAHAILLGLMLAWIEYWARMPVWYYVIVVSWPALSISMVRSLYEHRAVAEARERTTLTEAGWFMRLLFLNLNLHLVHHDIPKLQWYLLPAAYRMRQREYIEKSGGFWIRGGYWELFRLYALRQPDDIVHPLER